ncbi:hypothetical protein Q5P01_013155 [Channa striata]|uniref:Uncharacterized protein n=1 Tax=Channa striata TaxID=64152 RepID=A0AA88SN13_CHASR|nr:hypothetical protein Q5P01_013155 [Channa striata]
MSDPHAKTVSSIQDMWKSRFCGHSGARAAAEATPLHRGAVSEQRCGNIPAFGLRAFRDGSAGLSRSTCFSDLYLLLTTTS